MNIIKSLVYDFSVIGKGIIFPHFCDVSNYEKQDGGMKFISWLEGYVYVQSHEALTLGRRCW